MKKVLIIGGSAGIGLATSRRFLEAGAELVLTYHQHKKEALELVSSFPKQGKALFLDVCDPTSVEALYETLLRHNFMPDILIYNAGIDHTALVQDTSIEMWDKLYAINVRGFFLLTRLLLPHMIQRQSGVILATSSIWGTHPASCEVAYASTKGALNAFIRSLAAEVAPSQIRVMGLAPGPVETDMWNAYSEDEKKHIAADIPLYHQPMQADDVAAWLYFLTTPMAKHLTGQIITVDSGFTL